MDKFEAAVKETFGPLVLQYRECSSSSISVMSMKSVESEQSWLLRPNIRDDAPSTSTDYVCALKKCVSEPVSLQCSRNLRSSAGKSFKGINKKRRTKAKFTMSDSTLPPRICNITPDPFVEDLSESKDKGILRYLIHKGHGFDIPTNGVILEVHLVGKCNGTVFEDREVSFPIGEGSEFGICEGLEKVLEKFKKGEKSRIVLKSKYAFGEKGNPELNVPPNADVEYEVEIKNFEKLPAVTGVLKGDGTNCQHKEVAEGRVESGDFGNGNRKSQQTLSVVDDFDSDSDFGLGNLKCDEEFVLCDTFHHRVIVFDQGGMYKFQFGLPGKEDGMLWFPRKAAFLRSGNIVVCDSGNERNRIQIFNQIGQFVKSSSLSYINDVQGIITTASDDVLILDNTGILYQLTHRGDLVRWIYCGNNHNLNFEFPELNASTSFDVIRSGRTSNAVKPVSPVSFNSINWYELTSIGVLCFLSFINVTKGETTPLLKKTTTTEETQLPSFLDNFGNLQQYCWKALFYAFCNLTLAQHSTRATVGIIKGVRGVFNELRDWIRRPLQIQNLQIPLNILNSRNIVVDYFNNEIITALQTGPRNEAQLFAQLNVENDRVLQAVLRSLLLSLIISGEITVNGSGMYATTHAHQE